MELPIAVKISRKIDGSELYNGLRHLLGPAHAGALHAIFNQVLASSFDRATGNRPTVGEVFVIAHSRAVAIERPFPSVFPDSAWRLRQQSRPMAVGSHSRAGSRGPEVM